jgi:hypothetical protein
MIPEVSTQDNLEPYKFTYINISYSHETVSFNQYNLPNTMNKNTKRNLSSMN